MDKVTLEDFNPSSVWFVSAQYQGGTEVKLAGIIDDETGETYDLEPGDIGGAIPFDWDLEGRVNEAGEWEWDSRGIPTDDHGNTIRAIKAFR